MDIKRRDREILNGLMDSPEVGSTAPKATAEVPVEPPTPAPASWVPEKVVENTVLEKLKDAFGLKKVKTAELELNGVTFTLKAPPARWIAWADSLALTMVIGPGGDYSIPEYNARLQICLAGIYVSHINGVSILEAFEENEERAARSKFIEFLLDESSFELAKRLFDGYDELIEPNVKVMLGTQLDARLDLQVYICPKCNKASTYEKGEWFCDKDGAQLSEFHRESDLPLP